MRALLIILFLIAGFNAHADKQGPCKECQTLIAELEKKVHFDILCDPSTQDFLPKD